MADCEIAQGARHWLGFSGSRLLPERLANCLVLSVMTKGAAHVVNPSIRNFQGDEVTTAIMSRDVPVVVPGCPIVAQEMLHTVLRRNTWRVLIAHEGDPSRSFDDWPAVVGGCPRIAVGIRVHAHGGFDGVIHPENHGMGEEIVFREDVLNMAIVIAPARPSFQNPGEHPHRGVAESVGKGTRIEHMHSEMGSETAVE